MLIANGAIRSPEDRSVKGIEELRPELEPLRLAHRKFPEEREVEVSRPVGPQGVAPQVTEGERSGIHEGPRVEPLVGTPI